MNNAEDQICWSTESAPDWKYIGAVMSNFDHQIEEDIAKKLIEGKYLAEYPGWEFHAMIWWDIKECVFKAEVFRYSVHVGTAISTNLSGIMSLISDKYGWA